MAKQLNLSVNELWALLRRTFEALYGHERDYYDMARTVLWLECHGHDGVGQLIGALPHLENTKLPEPSLSETASGIISLTARVIAYFALEGPFVTWLWLMLRTMKPRI